jgi:hypothetical protein
MPRIILETRNCARHAWSVVVLLAVLCASIFVPAVSAQETGKYELGASYMYMRADTSAGGLSLNAGVDFSLVRNVNRWVAVVGDVGGYHAEGFRLGTYMAGARFTARVKRVSLFGQALFGGAHADAGARGFPAYQNSVAWAFGGGLDYRVSSRIALRLGEVDYLQTRLGSSVQNNVRVGAGIVFRFGAGLKR